LYLQRYSNPDDEILAEAVLVGGILKILVSVKGELSISDKIELEDGKLLKPFEGSSNINRLYSFISEAQVNEHVDKARIETLESLYKKIKSLWKKYFSIH